MKIVPPWMSRPGQSDDREESREQAVALLIEVMKDEPGWASIETPRERREVAGRLVCARWAVRTGRMNEGDLP